MISPLIRWKHTTNWPVVFSSSQERMMSGERKISVSSADKQYSFIAGHEIDSKVLYPGTGYLVSQLSYLRNAKNNVFFCKQISHPLIGKNF